MKVTLTISNVFNPKRVYYTIHHEGLKSLRLDPRRASKVIIEHLIIDVYNT